MASSTPFSRLDNYRPVSGTDRDNMPASRRSFARRLERCCCSCVSFFPLVIVYGLTSWAVWVQAHIGFLPAEGVWTGRTQAFLGIVFYLLLNWSYTTAVFTDPGSTTSRAPSNSSYSMLATQESGEAMSNSLTVKSTGETRFCKKCNAKKPDRAHHCSTCKRCVLKMDHHCPWLATCVGLRNYKAFLLFLIYVCLFCYVCFGASATWVWSEIVEEIPFNDKLMPVNYILLCVLAGVIGLVLSGFTGWHLYLAATNQTTIESLEKTRYLAPVRRSMQRQIAARRNYVDPSMMDQLREIHANALPGVLRPEEGEERPESESGAQQSLRQNWADREHLRERERYDEYLDERDSEKMPNAFDMGWRRNLLSIFGPKPTLWWLPITNSLGDGFHWEPSRQWLDARDDLARQREARIRENIAFEGERGWLDESRPLGSRPG